MDALLRRYKRVRIYPARHLYLPLWHPELNGSSFISRDHYGHLVTVSGATWGATGRTFDATNDYITLTAIQPMPAVGYIGIWAYKDDWAPGATRALFDAGAADGGGSRLGLWVAATNVARCLITTGGVDQVDINSDALSGAGWKYFEILYGLNNTSFFIDLAQIGSTDVACTMPTFAAGWVTRLGNLYSNTAGSFDGIIGEIIIQSGQPTLAERQSQYFATLPRYS